MQTFWLGIAGQPTPDQQDRLAAAGMGEKGVLGDAFSRTIHRTYFVLEAPSAEAAIERAGEILPELREEWDRDPPHLIFVKADNG